MPRPVRQCDLASSWSRSTGRPGPCAALPGQRDVAGRRRARSRLRCGRRSMSVLSRQLVNVQRGGGGGRRGVYDEGVGIPAGGCCGGGGAAVGQHRGIAAADGIARLLATGPPVVDRATGDAEIPAAPELSVEGVRFASPDSDCAVLEDVSFAIPGDWSSVYRLTPTLTVPASRCSSESNSSLRRRAARPPGARQRGRAQGLAHPNKVLALAAQIGLANGARLGGAVAFRRGDFRCSTT